MLNQDGFCCRSISTSSNSSRFSASTRAFFAGIVERLPGQYAFFHALSNGEVVSSDLLLCSRSTSTTSSAERTRTRSRSGRTTSSSIASPRGRSPEGKKRYVLGGGYAADDSLFRYKRAYARRGEVLFSVASFVHDQRGCGELAAQRAQFAAAAGTRWSPRSGFFPLYRA